VRSRRKSPVGLFDSGVGGLSVWREVIAMLPGEDTIYVADQAHCPYGERSPQEIRTLSEAISRFLLEQGAKLIVVACNTASTAALSHLREQFFVPFVGMEPAVKPAAERTSIGKVGVMATPTTLAGEPFARLLDRFAHGVEVVQSICPGLVHLVEEGDLDGPAMETRVSGYLQPLRDEGVDVLVLACTHYPFLRPVIERVMGPGVEIIDPAPAVAQQVRRVLGKEGLLNARQIGGQHLIFTSGDVQAFRGMVRRLVGRSGSVGRVSWACHEDTGPILSSSVLLRQ